MSSSLSILCFFILQSVILFASAVRSKGNSVENTDGSSWVAPWLQNDAQKNPFYFPVVHEIQKNRYTGSMFDYHVAKAKQEKRKFRQRGLMASSEDNHNNGIVNYTLDKDSNVYGVYYVNISLGSDGKTFSVVADTGSSLLWVPCLCQSCATNSSFLGPSPEYDPTKSSTASQLSCTSPQCKSNTSYSFECIPDSNFCWYNYSYVSGASTFGNLVIDTLNLPYSNYSTKNSSVIFGCSRIQTNELVNGNLGVDGIVGLGHSALSVHNQIAAKGHISSKMAMCLGGTQGGHLILGDTSLPPSLAYAPFIDSELPYYMLNLSGITIDDSDTSLQNNSYMIVDSGSTYTYFPHSLYSEFIKMMERALGIELIYYPDVELYCHNITYVDESSFRSDVNEFISASPNITLVFDSEHSWQFSYLNYWIIFITADPPASFFCLSVSSLSDLPFSILGELWMSNHFLHFDEENNKLGWLKLNCSEQSYTFIANSSSYPSPLPLPDSSPSPPNSSPPPFGRNASTFSTSSGNCIKSYHFWNWLGFFFAAFLSMLM